MNPVNERRLRGAGPLLLGILLALFGIRAHLLEGGRPVDETIFGDLGDGVFNLWVLEHGRRHILEGRAALGDGRMFWPEEPETFWWSDNLLAFQPVYAAAYAIFRHPVIAYHWTVLVLTLIAYAVLCRFYLLILRLIRPRPPPAAVWAVPLLGFVTAFSQIRLREYLHFQQFALIFLVCLLTACVRYLAAGRKRDVLLIGLWLTALAASAPYFAILGACLCLVWYLLVWSDRREGPLPFFLRHWPALSGTGVFFLWSLLPYFRTEAVRYSREDIRRLAMTPAHWVTPLHGPFRAILPDAEAGMFPGGYPGAGLLLGALMLGAVFLIRIPWRRVPDRLRRPGVYWGVLALLLLAGFAVGSRAFRGPAAVFRVLAALWGLGGWLRLRRQKRIPVSARTGAFLLLAAVTVYGMAAGPGYRFRNEWMDPGVWGFFAVWVPGFEHMRGVIRFAVAGQVLLTGVLFHFFLIGLRQKHARILRTGLTIIAGLFLFLQLIETRGMRVERTRLEPRHIQLQADEVAFFRDFEGPLLVTPTKPFHRNTFHMLRWRVSPGVRLVNGYSGRNAPLFEELMQLEIIHGRAAAEMIDRAAEAGVGHYAVFKPYVDAAATARIRERGTVKFENERLLVIKLSEGVAHN